MQIKPLPYKASGIRAFGIHLRNISDGVLDLLASNPLVFTCPNGLAILVLLNVGNVDHKALHHQYYTPGLLRLVVVHQRTNGQITGMSPLDSHLRQLLATLLSFKQLREAGYCAHVLEFSKSDAEENV
jgi:hypothetical protein